MGDNVCIKDLYRGILQEISDNGLPEMDIPKLDPLVIKDMEVVALGLINLRIKEGEAKGFKSCQSTSFK